MYDTCLMPHKYVGDISVTSSLPASERGTHPYRDDGNRCWSGVVSRYETHQNRFTELCSTIPHQRTDQGLHNLPERPSSNFNRYRSRGYQHRYSNNSSTTPPRFDSSSTGSRYQSDDSRYSPFSRTFDAPPEFAEESQCSHKIGWCVTQMSKWHVTLLSGWANTHMADCYFNLFAEGPIKYFNQVDLLHKFKIKATQRCHCADTSSNRCADDSSSFTDEIDDVITTFDDQPPIETCDVLRSLQDGSDVTLSIISDDTARSSDGQQSSENIIEKRFREILETLNKDLASNGDVTLEYVTLSGYANNKSPETSFTNSRSRPCSISFTSDSDSKSSVVSKYTRNSTDVCTILDCQHLASCSSSKTISLLTENAGTCSQISGDSPSTINKNNGAGHPSNQSSHLHTKPVENRLLALTYTGRDCSIADRPRLAEIPTEGVRIHRRNRELTWRDAVSSAWREGMSASWRNAPSYSRGAPHSLVPSYGRCSPHSLVPSYGRCSPHSLVPMGETASTVSARDVKYSTLRDEMSLKLSAVYNMGVQVTRAIIGRRTEVQHSPTSW